MDPEHLRQGVGLHGIVGLLRVQSVTRARGCTSCAPFTLICGALADGGETQRVEVPAGVVLHLLGQASVHHVFDAVDGDGRFGTVRGKHDLAFSSLYRREDSLLLLGLLFAVKLEAPEVGFHAHPLPQKLAALFGFCGRCDENENIARGFLRVNLDDLSHRCFAVGTLHFRLFFQA